jgi:hypothetical protein
MPLGNNRMGILEQLSSQLGDRTEQANLAIVARCKAKPELLNEIAAGFTKGDAALAGDCAEVFTHVSEDHPVLVAAYAQPIIALLDHPSTRVRWEAMHAVANIAILIPDKIAALLPTLRQKILRDSSVIVRDHAIRAVGNFAGIGPPSARAAFPILVESLSAWNGKHAALGLNGLAKAASWLPEKSETVRKISQQFESSNRGVVRKAAIALRKKVRTPENSN